MSRKSPFIIHKALIGIGGEPKSIKNYDQCQLFGNSQTSCSGQLTCSRCASAGHSSTDCTLEPKCINCLQSDASDSKLCPEWKLENQIQEIKTNKNISYSEARKLIVPEPSQTYAPITKPTAISTTTQTDPSITKIFPSLQCLSSISSTTSSMPAVSTSSSSAQAHVLPATSAKILTIQKSATPTPNSELFLIHLKSDRLLNRIQKIENAHKYKKKKPEIEIKMAKHKPRKSAPTEYTTDDEDMLMYDVAEELERDPTDKFVLKECPTNFPKEYLQLRILHTS
ncbi:hypothetical protein TNCV_3282751 [Trichonephila clavipes]|nr:hypothetical protein TNCV_3282751 [Trichonephila clavipes]